MAGYLEPFKEWRVADLIRSARKNLLAKLRLEYKTNALIYLNNYKADGVPFTDAFDGEPDQIIQIKKLFNALYFAEKAFEKIEGVNLLSPAALVIKMPGLVDDAYQASQMLTQISVDFMDSFQHELAGVSSYLDMLPAFSPDFFQSTDQAKQKKSISWNAGFFSGHMIDQMKPAAGKLDYDLLTYFSAVLPQHIEHARVSIEQQTSKMFKRAPNVNQEKVHDLIHKGELLADTIKNSKQGFVYFIRNIQSLIQQIQAVSIEIMSEVGFLDDTLQALIREYLAVLKYQILPNLFAFIDKLEVQLMLKPGRLSTPLMKQIKYLYERLIQQAKDHVDFSVKGEKLLKIEDSRFIALRLAPANQRINASRKTIHQVDRALTQLNECLQTIATNNPSPELRKRIITQVNTLLKPYLADLKDQLTIELGVQFSESDEPNWYHYLGDWAMGTRHNASIQNMHHELNQLKIRLQQVKADQNFKITLNQDLIDSVQEKSHHVLFPYNNPDSIYTVSEAEVLGRRSGLSESIRFSDQKSSLIVTNPEALNMHEAWDLYQCYDHKLTQLLNAEQDYDHLVQALRANQNQTMFVFSRDYAPRLLDKTLVNYEPNKLYTKIEGTDLKYQVLEPITSGCQIYLMSLRDAQKAGHSSCYVWNSKHNQLSYIAADGSVQDHLKLTNKALLMSYIKLFISLKKHRYKWADSLHLTQESIASLITDNGGHTPGLIHTGSIALSELNCTLRELTSTKQLTPFLDRIYDEALERGHIRDDRRAQQIKWYSSIQPYLVSAYKDHATKNIRAFDKKVTHLLSGKFLKQTGQPRPVLSSNEVMLQLLNLKHLVFAKEKKRLIKRRDDYLKRVQDNTPTAESTIREGIRHKEYSADVAEFMQSVEPIEHQIHESKKTLFKVKLAMKHLKRYSKGLSYNEHSLDDPLANQGNINYPYFHAYIAALYAESQTGDPIPDLKEKIQDYLTQIWFYETNQMKQNERLLNSVRQKNKLASFTSEHGVKTIDYSEINAFMHLCQDYEPVLMVSPLNAKPKKLYLRIENDNLHFSLLRYGTLQTGVIPLNRITPPLINFDGKTALDKDSLSTILYLIHQQRKGEIDNNPRILVPDEALDLYEWYISKEKELSDAQHAFEEWKNCLTQYADSNKKERVKLKIDAEKLYQVIQPYLIYAYKDDADNVARVNTFDDALLYFTTKKGLFKSRKSDLKYNEMSAFFTEEIEKIQAKIRLYKREAERPPALEIKPKRMPAKEIQTDRKHHLVKHKELSKSLTKLKNYIASNYTVFNKTLSKKLHARPTGVPYPEMEDQEKSIREPQQILAYKRIMNLVYYIEKIIDDIEGMNMQETRISYVMHLVNSYLYILKIVSLQSNLINDQYYHAVYREIVSNVGAIYKKATDEAMLYNPDEDNKNPVSNASLLSAMNLLKMLPDRITLGTNEFNDRVPLLKKSALKTTKNIERIINDYQSSFAIVLLFFDGLLIRRLINELRDDVTNLLTKTHDLVLADLERINTDILSRIILEADALEDKLGLKPGFISTPIKEILDEFYKGLLTPLVLDVDERITLLCRTNQIEQRKQAAKDRKKIAEAAAREHQRSADRIQNLSEANLEADPSFVGRNPDKDYSTPAVFDRLRVSYSRALPALKKALNGSELYIMSFEEAKIAGHTDCFIWDDNKFELYYINSDGIINDQLGCNLSLLTLDVDEELPDDIQERPTLIRQGNNYFMYGNSDGSGWKLTELDAANINAMDIDFDSNELLYNEKYTPMYNEITKKNGHIYPIYLKKSYKLMTLLNTKVKSPVSSSVYLSEHDIKKVISANSRFVFIKHGVSIPDDKDAINDINQFVPGKQTVSALNRLINEARAYYDGLKSTAALAIETAQEQIDFLKKLGKGHVRVQKSIRHSLLEDYSNEHIVDLCKPTGELHHAVGIEYQNNLQATLLTAQANFFTQTAVDTIDSQKTLDHLVEAKTRFDDDYLESYQQLNDVFNALDDLKSYLDQATAQWSTQYSLFESEQTIRTKQELLTILYSKASNVKEPIADRIQSMRVELKKDDVLDRLLDYQSYQTTSFALLCQKVVALFEALGLYTPKIVDQIESIMDAIDEPPVPKAPLLFFSGSKRDRLKARIKEDVEPGHDELTPD